jgi:hypothetical protein
VKEDEFNHLWQKKARFLADRKEGKVSKNTSKESIFAKRSATKPEEASQSPKNDGKEAKAGNSIRYGKTPDTLQREGVQLQQPPDDSHCGHKRFPKPNTSNAYSERSWPGEQYVKQHSVV